MSGQDAYACLHRFIQEVPDPRGSRGLRHPVADVLFILLVAVLAGAEDAVAVEDFAESNETWFRERCELPYGVPSQDTYLRLLALMDPAAFGRAFEAWVVHLWGAAAEGHVAIDGKTLRRSFDRATGRKAVHSVAAFASERGLVLGQVAVDEKENEIVAIPKLLQLIDLHGATVTIDAMGCQTAIARAIVEGGGDYVLQLKDNHPTLRGQVAGFFADAQRQQRALDDPAPVLQEDVQVSADHGRIEQRHARLSYDLSWVDQAADWANLSAIAQVQRRRENKATGEVSLEAAYYLVSSKDVTAADINELVRNHWAIENSMHWVLDVTFKEDQCRVRTGNAAENFGTIRRVALNLLRTAPNPANKRGQVSMARKRKYCLMSATYREAVLRMRPAGGA